MNNKKSWLPIYLEYFLSTILFAGGFVMSSYRYPRDKKASSIRHVAVGIVVELAPDPVVILVHQGLLLPPLGQALLGYSGFEAYGLNILAAFDVAPAMEKTEEGKPIYPVSQLESFCRTHKVLMGIITVPADHAQEVADQLIAGGIKAIWNFAPTHLDVPGNILVQNENMATSLAVLSVHLQAQIKEEKENKK